MTPPPDLRTRGEVAVDPGLPRRLDAQECWAQVRRQHVGRLAYASGRGRRHVVRPYTLKDRAVVLRVPSFHEAAPYAAGRRVSFDVVERLGVGGVAEVEVSGPACVVEGPVDPSFLEGLPDEGWPSDLPSSVLVVEVDRLRGTWRRVGAGPDAR